MTQLPNRRRGARGAASTRTLVCALAVLVAVILAYRAAVQWAVQSVVEISGKPNPGFDAGPKLETIQFDPADLQGVYFNPSGLGE